MSELSAAHGTLEMGTVTTPDLAGTERVYGERLFYEARHRGRVSPAQAAAWGAPAEGGSSYVILGPASGEPVFVRLVESAAPPAPFRPLRTYGWAALEITVQDADALCESFAGSELEVIGKPSEVGFSEAVYPMQAAGPADEVLYLNEVRGGVPEYDLPRAASAVGGIFIVVLATPDLAESVLFYVRALGLEQGPVYEVPYRTINRSFGLDAGTTHRFQMTGVGRRPVVEVDQYPAEAEMRLRRPGALPPGIASVSLTVDSLDAVGAPLLAPPLTLVEEPYSGRRMAAVVGPAGELVELIEGPRPT